MTPRTKQHATAELTTIQVDCDGTELGNFNDNRDPIVSHHKQTDEWLIAYKMPTGGTACAQLAVTGVDAVDAAVTAARAYLHAHKTTAVGLEGS
jgi:hypothetical protein